MPQTRLATKGEIDALPHPKKGQLIFWDTTLTGFGVVVGVRTKSFVLQRDVNGTSRRLTLGRYGDISLHLARQKAEQLGGRMRGGFDPVEEREKATAGGMTLREAWQLYEKFLITKERRPRTIGFYFECLTRYFPGWLDRPLIEITTKVARARHEEISEKNGKYAANGAMRTLRAVWKRAKRQHPGLPNPPTTNVDFNPERPRETVVNDLASWWSSVQTIANPIRRDFYIWLLFTGCRRNESQTLRWDQVDFENKLVHFSITKTEAFDLPLSDFLIKLLRGRQACEQTVAVYGKDCPWVFPALGTTGHIKEAKLNRAELKLFSAEWTPHTLRHTFISIAENKVTMPSMHARLLVNHTMSKSGDAHAGYIHPDLKDLRKSQNLMSAFLLKAIKPKPVGSKNVVPFRKRA